ncbi:MAG: pentapeptide repeat-containing protein [Acidimicrobiia bacterium]|nr:MAG: pentapeptide repeat-containing protein [Acidimicrobiia bacterium]
MRRPRVLTVVILFLTACGDPGGSPTSTLPSTVTTTTTASVTTSTVAAGPVAVPAGVIWEPVRHEAFEGTNTLQATAIVSVGERVVGLGFDEVIEGRSGEPVAWYSTDGREWASVALPTARRPELPDPEWPMFLPEYLAVSQESVVAAGYECVDMVAEGMVQFSCDTRLAAVWVSIDEGATWQRIDPETFGSVDANAWFVAGGLAGTDVGFILTASVLAPGDQEPLVHAFVSADGVAWEETGVLETPGILVPRAVVIADGMVVAISEEHLCDEKVARLAAHATAEGVTWDRLDALGPLPLDTLPITECGEAVGPPDLRVLRGVEASTLRIEPPDQEDVTWLVAQDRGAWIDVSDLVRADVVVAAAVPDGLMLLEEVSRSATNLVTFRAHIEAEIGWRELPMAPPQPGGYGRDAIRGTIAGVAVLGSDLVALAEDRGFGADDLMAWVSGPGEVTTPEPAVCDPGPGVDCSWAVLEGLDLSGMDLRGASFVGALLSEVDMGGANLTGADFRHSEVYGSNLAGADLSDADLRAAVISSTSLDGAALRGANLSYTRWWGVEVTGADLRGAFLLATDWSDVAASGAVFADTVANGANLEFLPGPIEPIDFGGATLVDARLSGSILDPGTIAGSDFTGADLTRAAISYLDLTGALFVGANLDGLVLNDVTCPDGSLSTDHGPVYDQSCPGL